MSEHNITSTLVKKPELKIQSARDGVWLHFKLESGQACSINIPIKFADTGLFTDKVLVEWCKQYATMLDGAFNAN